MEVDTVQPTERPLIAALSRLWWLPLIRGVMLVILGIYALMSPGLTIAALVQVMGFFLILDGLCAAVAGILGQVPSRGWTIARGAIAILIGGFVFAHPMLVAGVTAITIMYVVAFASIVSGIIEIVAAIQDRKQIEGEGWIILSGVLSVIFGILLLMQPLSFGLFMVRVLGVVAMILGITLLGFAIRLKGVAKRFAG